MVVFDSESRRRYALVFSRPRSQLMTTALHFVSAMIGRHDDLYVVNVSTSVLKDNAGVYFGTDAVTNAFIKLQKHQVGKEPCRNQTLGK